MMSVERKELFDLIKHEGPMTGSMAGAKLHKHATTCNEQLRAMADAGILVGLGNGVYALAEGVDTPHEPMH
jgi:predicted transcriptional regulator